jgi:hypothetical protein
MIFKTKRWVTNNVQGFDSSFSGRRNGSILCLINQNIICYVVGAVLEFCRKDWICDRESFATEKVDTFNNFNIRNEFLFK